MKRSSERGFKALCVFEPYRDPGDLRLELQQVDGQLAKWGLPELQPNQWDAVALWLHSCQFNRCATPDNQHPETSKMVQYLREGKFQLASAEFGMWIMRGGKINAELMDRRDAEAQYFLSAKLPNYLTN